MDPIAAFVLGGLFTAIVGLVTTEVAAWRAERRAIRQSLRETRLDALHKTIAWVSAYSRYALYSWVDATREWDSVAYADARPGLIGDREALTAYYAAINTIFRSDRDSNPPFVEDVEALSAATERVQRCLAEQVDAVAAGGDLIVIPEMDVADITSESTLIAGWWEGFGLEHKSNATAIRPHPTR